MTRLLAPSRLGAAAAACAVAGLALTGCSAWTSSSSTTTGSGSTVGSTAQGGPGGGGIGGSCAASGANPTPAAGSIPSAADDATVTATVTAAKAFVAALGSSDKVVVDNTLDGKRCSWSNFPDGLFNGRLGVTMGELDDTQKAAALALLKTVLSEDGYTQVVNQMAADAKAGGPGQQGPEYYHLVFFGEPSEDTPWTLSFGGHHLAVHVTLGGGVRSISPHFSGAQPIEYTNDAGQTVRTMGAESDAMFSLFTSLSDDQKAKATLGQAYDDLVMGPGTDTGYPAQEGLHYSELDEAQKKLVVDAMKGWVSDMAPELADAYLKTYTAQLDATTIAFSGDLAKDSGTTYMRIDGPRLWIEWINTNATGFHYHTVYRDKLLDYGTGAQ